jgi:hypothetical protein
VREQVAQAPDDAPELLGEPLAIGARSPGVQSRQRRGEQPKDADA